MARSREIPAADRIFWTLSIALLFSAHGDWPDHERRIASREAHLWIAALTLLTAVALEGIPRYAAAVAIAGMVLGNLGRVRYFESNASDPHVFLSCRLAEFLDAPLGEHEEPWSLRLQGLLMSPHFIRSKRARWAGIKPSRK
jgi:hypothetical protein